MEKAKPYLHAAVTGVVLAAFIFLGVTSCREQAEIAAEKNARPVLYDIGTEVKFRGQEIRGIVFDYRKERYINDYNIRYFNNFGERHTVYNVPEYELEPVE